MKIGTVYNDELVDKSVLTGCNRDSPLDSA